MSAREIIQELSRLTPAELQDVQRRVEELARTSNAETALRIKESAGHLVLVGPRIVRQAEVDAILAEFP